MKNTLNKLTVVFVVAMLMASILACAPAVGVVDATSDGKVWGGKNTADLWYYQADALNVQGIKQIVGTWNLSGVSEPVTIAVVDTGIDVNHEIFDGVLLENEEGEKLGYNANTATGEVSDGDSDRHGTQVASIIAMLIKELELDDYVKILPIKAGKKNTNGKWVFELNDIVSALEPVCNQNVKIDVVNLSLGLLKSEMNDASNDWSTHVGLQNTINLVAQNAVVVAAAGNKFKDSKNAEDVFYPAALDGVVSVMGYGEDGDLYHTSPTSGSNYGDSYDLIAPAEGIYSAKQQVGSSAVYNQSGLNGTSASAPLVSVAAALLKLQFVVEGTSVPNANALARMLNNVDGGFLQYGGYNLRKLDLFSLLTQNWDSTDFGYKNPVDIAVTYPDTYSSDDEHFDVYMLANKITPLTLSARLRPYGETDPSFDDAIEWFVKDASGNEKIIGNGTVIEYAPSSGGEYLVGARIKYDQTTYEDAFAWHVEFLPYVAGDVRVTYESFKDSDESGVPKSGIVYNDETHVFALTGLTYVDMGEPITWYVNGEMAAEGETFSFNTKDCGKYIITAKYGDENVLPVEQGFALEVKYFLLRPLDLSLLVVGVTIAIALVVSLSVLGAKRIRKKRKLYDCVSEYTSQK